MGNQDLDTVFPAAGPVTEEEEEDVDDNNMGDRIYESMVAHPIDARPETDKIVEQLQQQLSKNNALGTEQNPVAWPNQSDVPVNCSKCPGFFSQAFPHLFPYGEADFFSDHPFKCTFEQWMDHVFRHKSRRFTDDCRFTFFCYNLHMKEKLFLTGNLYANNELAKKTKGEIEAMLKQDGKSAEQLALKIQGPLSAYLEAKLT